MDVDKLLDDAKAAANLPTDKALSLHLGLSHGAVSNWRKGRALPDVVTCEKLAVLCGLPPLRVVAGVNELRAISAAEKKVWRRLAAAMFVGLLLTFPAVARVNSPTNGHAGEAPGVGIMRNVRRILRQLHAAAGRLARRRGVAYASPVLA